MRLLIENVRHVGYIVEDDGYHSYAIDFDNCCTLGLSSKNAISDAQIEKEIEKADEYLQKYLKIENNTFEYPVLAPELYGEYYVQEKNDFFLMRDFVGQYPVLIQNLKLVDGSELNGYTVFSELGKLLPGLKEKIDCPSCAAFGPLSKIIMHLNDVHNMPREALADWLETLDTDLNFAKVQDNGPV